MKGNKPILYPLERLLYSRKVLLAVAGVIVAVLGEYGVSHELVVSVNAFLVALIATIAIEDAAEKINN